MCDNLEYTSIMNNWRRWSQSEQAWYRKNITSVPLLGGDEVIMAYFGADNGKPVALVIHGFSGDHSGMLFLTRQLERHYRVVLLDLPCHGRSSLAAVNSATELGAMMAEAARQIQEITGDISVIMGHSIGCSIVSMLSPHFPAAKTIGICPVKTPSFSYRQFHTLLRHSAALALLQDTRLVSPLLGMALLKKRDRKSVRRVLYDARYKHRPSSQAVLARRRLLDIVFAYSEKVSFSPNLVIAGASDKTAHERTSSSLQRVFAASTVVMLPGGHLLPLESPEVIAHTIFEHDIIGI